MTRISFKKIALLSTLALTTLALAGCGDKEPEKSPAQIQYEQNVANAPERPETVTKMIEQSRGEPVLDEEGQPTGIYEGSLTKGVEREVVLASMTKDQLMQLDKAEQIEIYLNGIIRDEYHIAANTLYGEEVVAEQKENFKKALLAPASDNPEDGLIVDKVTVKSRMKDPDIARHFVEDVIAHMNRAFILPSISEDFQNRAIISGETYPILLSDSLNSIAKHAPEFVELESTSEFRRTEGDLKKLNAYYKDSFVNALEIAEVKGSSSSEKLGGFELNEDGLWVPSDMERLASSLVTLIFMK